MDKTTGALALVGTGSHAAVYLARLSGRMVAVKVGGCPPQDTSQQQRQQLQQQLMPGIKILLLPASVATAACYPRFRCLSWSLGWTLALSGRRCACCAVAPMSASCLSSG